MQKQVWEKQALVKFLFPWDFIWICILIIHPLLSGNGQTCLIIKLIIRFFILEWIYEGLAVGPFLLLIQKTYRTKRSLRFLPFSDLHQIQDRCKRKQACPPKMTKRLWKKDLCRDFNQHVTTTAKFWIMSLVRQSFRNILKLLV